MIQGLQYHSPLTLKLVQLSQWTQFERCLEQRLNQQQIFDAPTPFKPLVGVVSQNCVSFFPKHVWASLYFRVVERSKHPLEQAYMYHLNHKILKIKINNLHTHTIHGTGIFTYIYHKKTSTIHGSVNIPFVPWMRHGICHRTPTCGPRPWKASGPQVTGPGLWQCDDPQRTAASSTSLRSRWKMLEIDVENRWFN